jgi:methyltransferase
MSPAYAVLALVVIERLAELLISNRHTARLLAEGAVEAGAEHYRYFVLLHSAWLIAMFALVRPDTPLYWPPLALYILLSAARAWVMTSLGRFWTTRVITVPNAPLVKRGPYRFMRHPNYAVVTGEVLVLPLVFGFWKVALIFTLLNLVLLRFRIRVENAALASRRAA